jgi:hypothetical protein
VELAGAPAEMNKFVLPRDATLGVILLPTRIQVEMTPDNL